MAPPGSPREGIPVEDGLSVPGPAVYREWPVHPALTGRIACTWVNPGGRPRRPVLPDACMDLVWDGSRLRVAGPDTGPAEIASDATVVGIRFRPGAAPGFLGLSASELRDRRVPLADLWGRGANELEERLAAAAESAPIELERAVRARSEAARPVDPLVEAVVRSLLGSRGGPGLVDDLARGLDVSERTLLRRCVAGLGYGPKTLDRILRFRRALRLGQSGMSIAEAAAEAGFADQSHLTRECRRLSGASPAELFGGWDVVPTEVPPAACPDRSVQDAGRDTP